MVFLYEFEGGELMVIESVSPSQLFVYESVIITTAKNILVLNEQTYKPSSPHSPSVPPLKPPHPAPPDCSPLT